MEENISTSLKPEEILDLQIKKEPMDTDIVGLDLRINHQKPGGAAHNHEAMDWRTPQYKRMFEDEIMSSQQELSTPKVTESCGTLRPVLMVKNKMAPPSDDVQIKTEPIEPDQSDSPLELTSSIKTEKASMTNDTKDIIDKVDASKSPEEGAVRTKSPQDIVHTVSTSQGLCMVMPALLDDMDNAQELMTLQQQDGLMGSGRPLECEFCGRPFAAKSKLIEHLRTHTGEKPFKCDSCPKAFRQKCSLTVHLRTHTGEKPFKCNICTKAFVRKGDLLKHITFHNTGEKPFKCDLCTKAFFRKSNLDEHLRHHTGEKPFKCDLCGELFSRKDNLDVHFRRHTGEKPFKCDVCNKTFSRNYSLTVHMRHHTGEKPFKCDSCTRMFASKGELIKHIRRTHSPTAERPFQCDLCSKAFSEQGKLDQHLISHTIEKPFKCELCPKAFLKKSKLQRHMRTHTAHSGEKNLPPETGSETFSQIA